MELGVLTRLKEFTTGTHAWQEVLTHSAHRIPTSLLEFGSCFVKNKSKDNRDNTTENNINRISWLDHTKDMYYNAQKGTWGTCT